MSFYPGQKIVCVDDKFEPRKKAYYSEFPIAGRVYVVRESRISPATGRAGCLLVGIRGIFRDRFKMEQGFYQSRFRALDEMKQETADRQRAEQPQIIG